MKSVAGIFFSRKKFIIFMSQPVVVVSSSHMSNVIAMTFSPFSIFTRLITPSISFKGFNFVKGSNLVGGVLSFLTALRKSELFCVHSSAYKIPDIKKINIIVIKYFFMVIPPVDFENIISLIDF